MTAIPAEKKNIVSIGASAAVMGAALAWRDQGGSPTHRFILIDAKSHFHFIYAFPRACVKPGFERELFIPNTNLFRGNKSIGEVVHARVTAVHPHHLELDRDVPEFGRTIEFEYLIYAAGTTIPQPGRLAADTKKEAIETLHRYQQVIRESERPIIIGAGAVGLELAAEIKEHFPEKKVTLMHSRSRYMPRYKSSVDAMVYNILKKHGVRQVLGDRAILPKEGFPLKVQPVEVRTQAGKVIRGDLAIMCIGMTPNSQILAALAPKAISPSGFVRVKKTMQIDDGDMFPHIFAAGDVVDHKDVKTGHFAWMQGLAVMHNINKLINGASYSDLDPYVSKDVELVKLILGQKEAVMQTIVDDSLITVGSWIAGRSIPHNVYANAGWAWVDIPMDDAHLDL
ncbi:hypothetical protein BX666DRAFT_1897105 [Dichotomocladium elegans]|nr:hypothetical protein BX666DRAFT_1897105 [Dichotomocladium elegans]